MSKDKDPRLARAGVSGYNKPKRTPNHPTKSHVVVAKEGDQEDKEFERRLKVADRLLKERQLRGNRTNANDTNRNEQLSQPNQRGVQGPVRQAGATPSPIRPTGGQGQ